MYAIEVRYRRRDRRRAKLHTFQPVEPDFPPLVLSDAAWRRLGTPDLLSVTFRSELEAVEPLDGGQVRGHAV